MQISQLARQLHMSHYFIFTFSYIISTSTDIASFFTETLYFPLSHLLAKVVSELICLSTSYDTQVGVF